MKLHYFDVRSSKHIEPAFPAAAKAWADAILIMLSNTVTNFQQKEIVELALKSRLPVMHESARSMQDGALNSYGVNLPDWTAAPQRTWTRF